MLTEKLLKPEELLEKIDAKQTIEDLREPLARTIDEMSREADGPGAPRSVGLTPGRGPRCRAVAHARRRPEGGRQPVGRDEADLRGSRPAYLAVTILVKNKSNSTTMRAWAARREVHPRSGITRIREAVQMVAGPSTTLDHPAFGFFTGCQDGWPNLIFIPRDRRSCSGSSRYTGAARQGRGHRTTPAFWPRLFSADVILKRFERPAPSDVRAIERNSRR